MGPPKALWKRLPTYFPNIRLMMYPLTKAEKQQLTTTGDLAQVCSCVLSQQWPSAVVRCARTSSQE